MDTKSMSLAEDFPHLSVEGFVETSPATRVYNCIAWAVGRDDAWWWPAEGPDIHWPEGVPRMETVEAFWQLFESLGYVRCESGDLETGFEKVALYVKDRFPEHAARQLPDGRWTSKLGKQIDISHQLAGLEGPAYGQVRGFMKRVRPG